MNGYETASVLLGSLADSCDSCSILGDDGGVGLKNVVVLVVVEEVVEEVVVIVVLVLVVAAAVVKVVGGGGDSND